MPNNRFLDKVIWNLLIEDTLTFDMLCYYGRALMEEKCV